MKQKKPIILTILYITLSILSLSVSAQAGLACDRLTLDDSLLYDDDIGDGATPHYLDALWNTFFAPRPTYYRSRGFNDTPFAYRQIPEKAEASRVLLREHSAVVSTPENPVFAVIGPLNPCIGIILHNTENNHILSAHKACDTHLESLKPMVKALEITGPESLRLTIYSHYMPVNKYKELNASGLSFQIACAGHSQEEEHATVYQFFQKLTGIPASNIEDIIYMPFDKTSLLEAGVGASTHLMVDPEGHIANTSLYLGDYFNFGGAVISIMTDGAVDEYPYDDVDLETQITLNWFASRKLSSLIPEIRIQTAGTGLYGQYAFFDIRSLAEVNDTFFREIDLIEILW